MGTPCTCVLCNYAYCEFMIFTLTQALMVRARSTSPTRPTTTPDPEASGYIPETPLESAAPRSTTRRHPAVSGETTQRTHDEPGDAEAHDLYEWTKELNIDDIKSLLTLCLSKCDSFGMRKCILLMMLAQ